VNTAESVKARLKKIAVAENKPFNYILMHYFYRTSPISAFGLGVCGEFYSEGRAFLNRTGIEVTNNFTMVMADIRKFLAPLYDALINKTGFASHWDHEEGKWKKAT
jgi:hypothetical protein